MRNAANEMERKPCRGSIGGLEGSKVEHPQTNFQQIFVFPENALRGQEAPPIREHKEEK
jgi:hypothetical protein